MSGGEPMIASINPWMTLELDESAERSDVVATGARSTLLDALAATRRRSPP